MSRGPTIFLQMVTVLVGVGTASLLLWEPHLEGRNAHATLFQIYFNDPFLAFAYVASLAWFAVLYQTFRLFGYIRQDKAFSPEAVKAARATKYFALLIIGLVALGELFIALGTSDDRAGGVFIGVLIVFGSIVIACAAAVVEAMLQRAVDLKFVGTLGTHS
jgi:hypothetical protein